MNQPERNSRSFDATELPDFAHDLATLTPRVRALAILGFALIIPCLLYLGYTTQQNEERAAQAQMLLVRELKAIEPMPGVRSLQFDANHKSTQAFVSVNFRTDAPFDEVCSYYDQEMSRCGWELCGSRSIREWGRDFGRVGRYYRKGPYRAAIEHTGTAAPRKGQYALSLTWGLYIDCPP